MTATIFSLDAARASRAPGALRALPPAVLVEPPSDDPAVERAADVLREMERRPWLGPVVRLVRALDRRARVHVAVGSVSVGLEPDEALLVARALRADPGQPGCLAVADDLESAAERARSANAVLHVPTGARAPLGTRAWIVAALAVAALILAAAIGRAGA